MSVKSIYGRPIDVKNYSELQVLHSSSREHMFGDPYCFDPLLIHLPCVGPSVNCDTLTTGTRATVLTVAHIRKGCDGDRLVIKTEHNIDGATLHFSDCRQRRRPP